MRRTQGLYRWTHYAGQFAERIGSMSEYQLIDSGQGRKTVQIDAAKQAAQESSHLLVREMQREPTHMVFDLHAAVVVGGVRRHVVVLRAEHQAPRP